MTTLQEMLVARVGGDPRAQNAVVESNAGRPRILLGSVGQHGRITLSVEGNAVKILYPTDLADPADLIDAAADAARALMTPDNTQPGSNLAPNAFTLAGGGDFEVRDGLIFAKDSGEALFLYSAAQLEAMRAAPVDTQAGQPIERPTEAGGDQPVNGTVVQPEGENGGASETNPAPEGSAEALAIDAAIASANAPAGSAPAGAEADAAALKAQPAPENETPAGGASEPVSIDHKAYSRDALIAMAKEAGAKHDSDANKATIADAINKAKAAK